jgi:hypothetical protein
VEFLWSRKLLKTRTNGRAGTRTPPAGPGEPTEGNTCPTLGSVAGRGLRASLSSTRHRRQRRRRVGSRTSECKRLARCEVDDQLSRRVRRRRHAARAIADRVGD